MWVCVLRQRSSQTWHTIAEVLNGLFHLTLCAEQVGLRWRRMEASNHHLVAEADDPRFSANFVAKVRRYMLQHHPTFEPADFPNQVVLAENVDSINRVVAAWERWTMAWTDLEAAYPTVLASRP